VLVGRVVVDAVVEDVEVVVVRWLGYFFILESLIVRRLRSLVSGFGLVSCG